MKKESARRRLALHRERLRRLTSERLREVGGGGARVQTSSCQTTTTSPSKVAQGVAVCCDTES